MLGFRTKPDIKTSILFPLPPPENLFDSETGIYVLGNKYQEFSEAGALNGEELARSTHWEMWDANYRERGLEWERKSHIQIFDKSQSFVLSQDIGLRIQGGGSRGFLPKSLNIYAEKNTVIINYVMIFGGQATIPNE